MIGTLLKDIRILRKIDQKDLAKELHISVKKLKDIENNKIPICNNIKSDKKLIERFSSSLKIPSSIIIFLTFQTDLCFTEEFTKASSSLQSYIKRLVEIETLSIDLNNIETEEYFLHIWDLKQNLSK